RHLLRLAPMKTEQRMWRPGTGWLAAACAPLAQCAQLVLVFGGTAVLRDTSVVKQIREIYPAAHILGCSTSGEICGTEVSDDSLVATAIYFEHTQVRAAQVSLDANPDSQQAGGLFGGAPPHTFGGAGGRSGETL